MSEKRYIQLQDGDIVQEGDEILQYQDVDEWQWRRVGGKVLKSLIGRKLCTHTATIFRRPIAEPTDNLREVDTSPREGDRDDTAAPVQPCRIMGNPNAEGIGVTAGRDRHLYSENGGEVGTLDEDLINLLDTAMIVLEHVMASIGEAPSADDRELSRQIMIDYKAIRRSRTTTTTAEKERDEWREIARNLRRVVEDDQHSTERAEALAAYELKAKEGV